VSRALDRLSMQSIIGSTVVANTALIILHKYKIDIIPQID